MAGHSCKDKQIAAHNAAINALFTAKHHSPRQARSPPSASYPLRGPHIEFIQAIPPPTRIHQLNHQGSMTLNILRELHQDFRTYLMGMPAGQLRMLRAIRYLPVATMQFQLAGCARSARACWRNWPRWPTPQSTSIALALLSTLASALPATAPLKAWKTGSTVPMNSSAGLTEWAESGVHGLRAGFRFPCKRLSSCVYPRRLQVTTLQRAILSLP